MPVFERKPHRLQFLVQLPGYDDESGNYQAGESHWEGGIPCDAVPSGKAEEKAFEDGTVRKYSYTVYLPPECRPFFIGDRVKISFFWKTEREFEVKGFQRYQNQCKLWV